MAACCALQSALSYQSRRVRHIWTSLLYLNRGWHPTICTSSRHMDIRKRVIQSGQSRGAEALLVPRLPVSHAVPTAQFLQSSGQDQNEGLRLGALGDTLRQLDHWAREPQSLDLPVEGLVCVLKEFVEQHYGNLIQEFSWMQPVHMVSRLQLQLMDLFQLNFGPIWEHEGYGLLLDKIRSKVPEFSRSETVTVLHDLLLLGIDKSSPVLLDIMDRCRQDISTYDIHDLGDFGNSIRLLPKGFFFQSLHPSLTRYAELVPVVEANCTVAGLVGLVGAFRNLHMYSSMDLLVRSGLSFMKIIQECKDDLRNQDEINALSYIGRRLYRSGHFQDSMMKDMPKELAQIAADASVTYIDKYDARHLAEMCTSLKPMKQYTPEVASVFQGRALKLVTATDRVADVCNLFYCLTPSTPLNIRRTFESALYTKMDDLDPLTLANLADAFQYMNMDNEDIIKRYQELMLTRARGLTQGPSHLFQSQIRYILGTNFTTKAMRQKMFQLVVDFVQENQVVLAYYTPSIANFCLLNFDGRLHPMLMEEFLRSIPKWRMTSMKKLLEELSNSRRVNHPQIQIILAELQHQIYIQILEKPEMIRSVAELTGFVHTMALHAYYRDPTLTDQLMRMYLNFKDELTRINIEKIAKIFVILHYYAPQVMDLLVGRLCEDSTNHLPVLNRVLLACARVGHVPARMDDFLELILKSLDERADDGSDVIGLELDMMKSLSILQIYPEEKLSRIFSLDYIELVDDYVGAHPEEQREVENAMMELNRNVLLECPQLDVPWFHEAYCRKYTSNEPSADGYKKEFLHEDILERLTEAMGGEEYVRAKTFSPYFYPLDFECCYDITSRQPVSMKALDDLDQRDVQRVAVLPLTVRDFCYNSQRLVGREQAKRRQLEMMGYKVVQIPHFTWYSMGLGDDESKVTFLKDKILSAT